MPAASSRGLGAIQPDARAGPPPAIPGRGGVTRGRAGHKAPGQRQLRVGEAMRHALAELLLRGLVRHPLVAAASLTVSEVRIGRDLRHATVFVAAFGREPEPELLAALDRAGPALAGQLTRMLHLKYAPSLHFRADTSFAEAARIEHLLAQARRGGTGGDDGA